MQGEPRSMLSSSHGNETFEDTRFGDKYVLEILRTGKDLCSKRPIPANRCGFMELWDVAGASGGTLDPKDRAGNERCFLAASSRCGQLSSWEPGVGEHTPGEARVAGPWLGLGPDWPRGMPPCRTFRQQPWRARCQSSCRMRCRRKQVAS